MYNFQVVKYSARLFILIIVLSGCHNRSETVVLSEDGAWCWFSDPRAVYFEGQHKRTYAGWVSSQGNITIGYLDQEDGSTDIAVLSPNLQADDHDNPSILFSGEGRIMVFYNMHGGANPLFMCKSSVPEDIHSFGPPIRLDLNDTERYPEFANTYTYTNPVMLSAENNRIWLFWRGLDNKPNYAWSDDEGETWEKGGIFILPDRIYSMRRPYVKVAGDGRSRIHFAFTDGHPRKEPENSIYYMYYENGMLYHANGEKIAKMGDPVRPRQADCVYDATRKGSKAWIWDVAYRNEGPCVVFASFPDDSSHIYHYALWNGKSWIDRELVNSGKWFPHTPAQETEPEPNYSGGIVLDHEDPSICYLSVNRGGRFVIEQWKNTDSGNNWTIEKQSSDTVHDQVRPFAVRGAEEGNPVQVVWMSLSGYRHYTDFNSSLVTKTP